MMVLLQQIPEGLVGELLKAAAAFLAKQIDRSPRLVVELDAFSDHCLSLGKRRQCSSFEE
jgi:hypothetical protein